ncbi:MAG: LysR family transcriptional regulator, partial [Lachnospiraceae bacterium]|nr:LysR family transcriptional regulator [Lachnospiraceae bacterium]
LNQLQYFIAAAETHSFTKAAEQYYISQTAVTQQIKALEESIGCALFNRTTRPVTLTPAGNVFLLEAKAIIERTKNAIARTQDAATGLVGSLLVGYTKGYERSNLSYRLRDFHRNFSNVLINCYRASADVLAAGLLNEEYDIIFTWDSTNLCHDSSICCQEIEKAPLVVALYSNHPFAQRKFLYRSDLKNEAILYMSPSTSGNSFGDAHFMNLYQEAGYLPNILFRSTDTESILMMVAAEEGISILPDYCTRKLDNADNLTFLPLIGENEVEIITALWRKDNTNPALQHFLKTILFPPVTVPSPKTNQRTSKN